MHTHVAQGFSPETPRALIFSRIPGRSAMATHIAANTDIARGVRAKALPYGAGRNRGR
jgi:hypothetical protein